MRRVNIPGDDVLALEGAPPGTQPEQQVLDALGEEELTAMIPVSYTHLVNFELRSGGRGHIAACNKSIAQAGWLRNERQNLHLETT